MDSTQKAAKPSPSGDLTGSATLWMMSYRKGTYEERIERAFLEVTADIKLG